MNPLTPDPGLLFWMVLSFGVVFFLLAKFGFPVIVKAINERKEFIEMSLLSAKQANEKLATIQAEGEKLLADAKAQQKDIIAGAMQEKQQIVRAAQEEAQASATSSHSRSQHSCEALGHRLVHPAVCPQLPAPSGTAGVWFAIAERHKHQLQYGQSRLVLFLPQCLFPQT